MDLKKCLQPSMIVEEGAFVAVYLLNALNLSVNRQTVFEGAFILRSKVR